MKKTRLDGLKLEDEALKGVSGGMSKEYVELPCVYCGVKQKLSKYSGVSVRVGNEIYRNAVKYVCPDKTRLFYVVTTDGKSYIITDNWEMFPAPMFYL